jgi:hypothetical protein
MIREGTQMNRTKSIIVCTAILALLASGCGGMEEEEEEMSSAEQALLKLPPSSSCPSGFTKVTNTACNPGSTPCYKCCGWVPSGPFYQYQCFYAPTCELCPWNMCGCYHPGYARAVSCYITTTYYAGSFIYVWRCAMSDGTTCTYNYFTGERLYCR